jgi:hypothetical protein
MMRSRYIDSISYCCMRIRVGKRLHVAPLMAIVHLYLCFGAIYGRGNLCLISNSNIVLYTGPYALFYSLFLVIFVKSHAQRWVKKTADEFFKRHVKQFCFCLLLNSNIDTMIKNDERFAGFLCWLAHLL